jgi:competence protein ComEA
MNEFEPERPAGRWLVRPGVYSGKFSWGGSLLLKCAVLGVGVLFVYWVGWPQPGLPTVSVSPSSRPGFLTSGTTQLGSAGRTHVAAHVGPLRGKEVEVVQPVHAVEGREIGQNREPTSFIVDLNDGTSAELAHLPGIGAVLAGRIVAHRVSHGAFRRVEDLALVPGIGEKRLQQLRPFVGVREPSSESGMGS